MKRFNSTLNVISDKQVKRERNLWKYKQYLIKERAHGRCEIPNCKSQNVKLDQHHVIKRSRGGADTPDNLLIVCRVCHGPSGIPISVSEALKLVKCLNREHNITWSEVGLDK